MMRCLAFDLRIAHSPVSVDRTAPRDRFADKVLVKTVSGCIGDRQSRLRFVLLRLRLHVDVLLAQGV
jgi:hypothetical protein